MIKFGLFTDAHYANNKQYGNRYCGFSINKIEECINTFCEREVEFIVNLGDTIDKAGNKEEDIKNIKKVAGVFEKFDGSIYTIMGNHDVESMDKSTFMKTLGIETDKTYYSFDFKNWHFIILDANYTDKEIEYDKGNYEWTDSYIPTKQKEWLVKDIENCENDNIIIFIHQDLDHRLWEGKTDPHIVRNAPEIRRILEKSNKKITVIQGHYHHGDYQVINGIEYITLRGMCEGDGLDNNSYMIANIDDEDNIKFIGFNEQRSYNS